MAAVMIINAAPMAASGTMLSSVEKPKMWENGGKTMTLLSEPAMLAPRGKRQMRDNTNMAVATATYAINVEPWVANSRSAEKKGQYNGSAQILNGLPKPAAPWRGLSTFTWKAAANSRISRISDCHILPSPPV